jgi:transcriptional regulator with XRE-family HTH domain
MADYPGLGATGLGSLTDAERAFVLALGERVRLRRVGRGWSQSRLATAAGLSRVFLSAVERGLHAANVVRLHRLASALDVPLAELLAETSTTTPVPGGRPGTEARGCTP